MKQFKSITVSDLMHLLRDQDENALVAFSSDYGDHCHTEQLHRLQGDIEEMEVQETGYSESGFCVSEDGDSGDDYQKVLVIS